MAVLTVGHSNRSLADLIGMLQAFGVKRVVDVRNIPRSRYNPQFNSDVFAKSLVEIDIHYTHAKDLGGFRHARKDSVNTGWHNGSFQGYADYMQTDEFGAALDKLIRASQTEQVTIMCAEAVPWRCHRSLIADALTARGLGVKHIMSATQANPHVLTSFAQVTGTRVTYPAK